MIRTLLMASFLALLAGCNDPPPDPDAPPEPQATALRDAIEEPLDKAHDVEAAQAEHDAERDAALDAAGG